MNQREVSDPTEEGAIGDRSKTFTEKGHIYHREMSLKKFRSSVVAWTRACNKAKEVYQTTSSFTDLTEARDKKKASYSCIVEVYDSLVALSEEDLDSSITSHFKETSIENSALLDKIGLRLSSLKWEENSTQSKASQRSKGSSSSRRSHSLMAVEAAKIVEAQTKLKFLELESSKKSPVRGTAACVGADSDGVRSASDCSGFRGCSDKI